MAQIYKFCQRNDRIYINIVIVMTELMFIKMLSIVFQLFSLNQRNISLR
jgi:hypothetical protein